MGTLAATVAQQPAEIGAWAWNLLKFLNGETVPAAIPVLVTK